MDTIETLKELDTLGGPSVFRLKTINFAVLAEQTIDETAHIEQHRPQSYTIGDAIDTLQSRGVTHKDRIRSRRARTREAPKKQILNENRTRAKKQSGWRPQNS